LISTFPGESTFPGVSQATTAGSQGGSAAATGAAAIASAAAMAAKSNATPEVLTGMTFLPRAVIRRPVNGKYHHKCWWQRLLTFIAGQRAAAKVVAHSYLSVLCCDAVTNAYLSTGH